MGMLLSEGELVNTHFLLICDAERHSLYSAEYFLFSRDWCSDCH